MSTNVTVEGLRAAARSVLGDGVWVDDRPSRPLSSLELMRFALRVERLFQVRFQDADLTPENVSSFGAVMSTLERSARTPASGGSR